MRSINTAKESRYARFAALLWLPVAFALSVPAYRRHQEVFRGTGNYYLIIEALPILAALAIVYGLWVHPRVRRFELGLLIGAPSAAICLLQPRAFLSLTVIAGAALVLGDILSAVMDFEEDDAPAVWACGFGLLILLGAALGKFKMLWAPVLAIFFLLCAYRLSFAWRRILTWLKQPFQRWTDSSRAAPSTGVCFFFLTFFVACSLLMALTPVITFDVTAYHFPLAQRYVQTRSIEPTPWIVQSYYPQGAEILLAMCFALGGEPAARLLSPVVGVLLLWQLFLIGQGCGLNRSAAACGVTIAATFPFLQWTLTVPKNDCILSLFQMSALYGFLQWQKGRGAKWLIVTAFLLGQTAGIKHVALFGLVAMAPLCLFAWARERLSVRLALLMILVFAASGLFWHARTWMLTGNPVYPNSQGQATHALVKEHRDPLTGAFIRYSRLPWNLLFHGEKAFESPSPSPLGMFCLFLLPAALIACVYGKWDKARLACLGFSGFYILYWLTVSSTLRYAIVPFCLLALALGASLVRSTRTGTILTRAMSLTASAYGLLFSLLVVMSFEVNTLEPRFILHGITANAYLSESTPAVGPLLRLRQDAPSASVFGVDVCARYYAPDPIHFGCGSCDENCEPDNILASLRSHLFQFAVVPDTPRLQFLRERIKAETGARLIGDDGKFSTLFLPSKTVSPSYR